jgi:SH3 domain protein
MKKLTVLILILFTVFLAGQVSAKYISDNLKITARTGPGTDYKIITMLQADQEVKVLKTSGGWSQIQLAEGEFGWVLSRFLTSDEPCRHIFAKLEKDYTELQKQATELQNQTAELQKQILPLAEEIKRLKKEKKELATQLAEQTKQARNLKNKLDGLKQNQVYQLFLLGAGVLLTGFALGFILRPRRKSGY